MLQNIIQSIHVTWFYTSHEILYLLEKMKF